MRARRRRRMRMRADAMATRAEPLRVSVRVLCRLGLFHSQINDEFNPRRPGEGLDPPSMSCAYGKRAIHEMTLD